jgi:hypothetical protein
MNLMSSASAFAHKLAIIEPLTVRVDSPADQFIEFMPPGFMGISQIGSVSGGR